MLKKLLLLIGGCVVSIGFAFAQVDVNKADQAGLDGIKGIGPKMSQRVLDERKKGGDFKDWNDLQRRVKGIKEKSATRLSNAGLTVNGQSKNGAVVPAEPMSVSLPKSSSKMQSAKNGDPAVNRPVAVGKNPKVDTKK